MVDLVSSPRRVQAHPRRYAEKLNQQGFFLVSKLLPSDLCSAVNDLVTEKLKDPNVILGTIRGKDRYDILLPLEGAVKVALNRCLRVLIGVFVASEAKALLELAALRVSPGAAAQAWHRDTEGHTKTVLTTFIALADVTPIRGPTEVKPYSHLLGPILDATGSNEGGRVFQVCLPLGHAMVMDSRLLHRGSRCHEGPRTLFYFSVRLRGTKPRGTTISLLPSLHGILLPRPTIESDESEKEDDPNLPIGEWLMVPVKIH